MFDLNGFNSLNQALTGYICLEQQDFTLFEEDSDCDFSLISVEAKRRVMESPCSSSDSQQSQTDYEGGRKRRKKNKDSKKSKKEKKTTTFAEEDNK